MNNAVAVWKLEIEAARPQFEAIAKADGNLVTYQREALFAMQLFDKSDGLQKCSPPSIRNAVINVASVGLTINPAMKLAYLVPRKGVACLDISYIGLVKLATDSGGVLAVAAIPVRANDQFTYADPFTMPVHKFSPFDDETVRGDIVGVYTVAKLASGITQIDTLSREEINKIRAVSKASSGPWVEWFEEMVKKSGVKRASKMWPRTERMAMAEAILNEHEGMVIDNADSEVKEKIAQPKSKSQSSETPSPEPINGTSTLMAEAGECAYLNNKIKALKETTLETLLTEAGLATMDNLSKDGFVAMKDALKGKK